MLLYNNNGNFTAQTKPTVAIEDERDSQCWVALWSGKGRNSDVSVTNIITFPELFLQPQRPRSAVSLSASIGALSWLQFSRSKTDDFVTRRNLNAAQIGADCRKITSEFPRMLHSMFSYFLNNRVSHLSTSNNSSGEQISGHPYPSASTICLTVLRVNGLFK
jgi:hypothetical protein